MQPIKIPVIKSNFQRFCEHSFCLTKGGGIGERQTERVGYRPCLVSQLFVSALAGPVGYLSVCNRAQRLAIFAQLQFHLSFVLPQIDRERERERWGGGEEEESELHSSIAFFTPYLKELCSCLCVCRFFTFFSGPIL